MPAPRQRITVRTTSTSHVDSNPQQVIYNPNSNRKRKLFLLTVVALFVTGTVIIVFNWQTVSTATPIAVNEFEEYIHITFPNAVMFESGQSYLTSDSRELIDSLAKILVQYPNHRIVIHGHSTNIPRFGDLFSLTRPYQYSSNIHLSVARAASVAVHLIYHHGFDPILIESVGMGEFRPIDTNSTPEGRANNRRVDVFVFPPVDDEIEVYRHFFLPLIFELDRSRLSAFGREMIDNMASILAQYPNYRIVIHGHTDNMPVGVNSWYPSNIHLSATRAASVAVYLIYHHGFDPILIESVGMGKFRPIYTNNTPEGRANNSRVEILVFPQS